MQQNNDTDIHTKDNSVYNVHLIELQEETENINAA
jgi:hypothetical protein